MTIALLAPFALSASFAAIARLTLRKVDPRSATWIVTVGAVVSAVTTTGSLALLSWPLVARIPAVADIGEWSPELVQHGVPIPGAVSVAALGALLWVGIRLLRAAAAFARELLAICPTDAHTSDLTVLNDEVPAAYSVPSIVGRRGRTVMSTGLLRILDPDERAAVLAHERAHIDCGHHWFAILLRLSGRANPMLIGIEDLGMFVIERWADERAAQRTDRRTTARAVARAALGRIATEATAGAALHVAAGGVSERVAALLVDAPARSRTRWALMLVVFGGVMAIGVACHDMEGLFETLRRVS